MNPTAQSRAILRATGRIAALAAGGLCLLGASPAHAALKLNYQRVQDGQTTENRLTFDDMHLRMDGLPHEGAPAGHDPGGGTAPRGPRAHAVILDGTLHKMLMINTEGKSYREITESDMKQVKERMVAMRTQMAERMKNMPPEQRKMMEKMMGGKGAAGAAMMSGETLAVTYESMGQKKTVAGFPCQMFKVMLGQVLLSQTCFAPWDANVVNKAEAEKFKNLALELKKMFDMGQGAGAGQDWTKVPGMPVEEVHFAPDGKTATWTNTLKSVERGAVPADTFSAPAGFKKEEGGMFGPGGPGGPGGPAGPGGRPR